MKNAIHINMRLDYEAFKLEAKLSLPAQGVTAVYGASGSGKTSLLRYIAGLEKNGTGELRLGEDVWQDHHRFMPPHKRPIGYVFQEASLFDHLSVQGNLQYAIKRAPPTSQETNIIGYEQVIELLGIDKLLSRHPHELSGGEQQRAAIARTLLIQPRLLLMDEPLSALDLPRKLDIMPYLERLKQTLDLPIIYVSHSADEIARLADHLVVLDEGKVISSGPLADTLSRLDSPLRLGEEAGVILEGVVIERDAQWHLARVRFNGGDVWIPDKGHASDSEVRIRVLARDISLSKSEHQDSSIVNVLPAEIVDIANDEHEGLALVRLKMGGSFLVSRVTKRSVEKLALEIGGKTWAQIKSVAVV